MRKKSLNYLFLLLIFYSILANLQAVKGLEYNYEFTEIGIIDSGNSVIGFQCINNELAFVMDVTNRIVVFNITEPTNIVELFSYSIYLPHDVELDLDRDLVYATSSNGVYIFNYSTIDSLQLLSVYSNYNHSNYIQVQGELLFVGAEELGLQIVNVTDPSNPIMLDSWIDPVGDVSQVYVMGNYAFIATHIIGIDMSNTYLNLKVLDIFDPTNITYVSTVDTGENYNGGAPRAYNNDLVYFNDHAFGLKILNFSDPYNVSVVSNFTDGGFYNDLELIDGDIAYLADYSFGLKVVNCTDLENPFLIGTFELDWRTLRVVVKDTRIYLATFTGGIRILSLEIVTVGISAFPFWIIGSIIITQSVLYYSLKRNKK